MPMPWVLSVSCAFQTDVRKPHGEQRGELMLHHEEPKGRVRHSRTRIRPGRTHQRTQRVECHPEQDL